MPKKLGQVAKLVAGIQDTHEDLLDKLRKANNAFNTHKEVIEEGEAELAKQIKKVRPTGKTGDVVSDYARDVTAGKMITELENQRSLLVKANNEDLLTRQAIKGNIDASTTVIQSAQEIADDKKRKWIVSSTVPKLEALIDELQTWHDQEEQDFKKLGLKAKPIAWAQPGMLKKMTVDNLLAVDHKYMTDQDTIKWLAFRSKIDKSRKNALTKIHADMVGLAKQEKDA